MAEIVLVRHGQANSQAKDEASYDRLSETGHLQARWLGEYFSQTNPHFDHVVIGGMQRHRETASGLRNTPTEIDPRWNEVDYFALSRAMEKKTGDPHPADHAAFPAHVSRMFQLWQEEQLDDAPETYEGFRTRVMAGFEHVASRGGRSLVVTSTGVIGMVMKHVLDLNHSGHMKVVIQTANTSIHRIERLHGQDYVAEYGATPHLDTPERKLKRTHY